MVRAPCCEKMGMKKGPWTQEEDHILTSHIQRYGHSNWRALPKLAGLLRCGKSCRLRWINYLRPDIKRGNFTPEEEDMIISLHKVLGNRWSAIAARLPPGRTDNEIKNVWHTHLKKRANPATPMKQEFTQSNIVVERVSSSSHSSLSNNPSKNNEYTESSSADETIDDNFWIETLMMNEDFGNVSKDDCRLNATNELSAEEDIDYWFKFASEVGEFLDLPEL